MIDTKEVIEQLNKDVIIEIMDELGSPLFGVGTTSDNVEYLMFNTICHGGDSKNKLWWYSNTKNFQCWTCCGNMNIFELVQKVKHCEFYEALTYVAEKLGIKTSNSREGFSHTATVKEANSRIAYVAKELEMRRGYQIIANPNLPVYNDSILNYFDSNTFYQGWVDEGITFDTMKKYKISWYEYQKCIVIPHYNIDGELVGIRRRSLKPEDAKNKYMPLYVAGESYEHPLGLNLYGLYENKEAIEKKHEAVIVEGEKSVLLSDSFYGNYSVAVATCGFNISDAQINMLKKLKVNKVYLGFDKDFDMLKEQEYMKDSHIWEQYLHYKKRLHVLAQRLLPSFNVAILKDKRGLLDLKDSPMDKGKVVFETLKADATLIRTDYKGEFNI